MNKGYCIENFRKVFYHLLIHPGDMKSRMKKVQSDLEMVNASIPEEFKAEWQVIWKSFMKYPAMKNENGKVLIDEFKSNVFRRHNRTLSEIVERMYLFYNEKF